MILFLFLLKFSSKFKPKSIRQPAMLKEMLKSKNKIYISVSKLKFSKQKSISIQPLTIPLKEKNLNQRLRR